MLLLCCCLAKIDILKFVFEGSHYSFNLFGIQKFNLKNEVIESTPNYFYIIDILMILLTFNTLMKYKNLSQQLKWARNISFMYLTMVIALVIFAAIGNKYFFDGLGTRELGAGFSILVISFPFSYLAQLAIKRDKKLLDSLNRLR